MSKPRRREVFHDFVERAEEELGDSLRKIILYGSVARGEDTRDSDIGVFAIVEAEEDLERLIVIVAIIFVTTSQERLSRGLNPTNCDSPAVKTRNNHYEAYGF